MLHSTDERTLLEHGQKRAIDLFHQMAQRVPAYQDFLHQYQFDPATVQSAEDFSRIPLINKDNYLRKYSLDQLSWDGNFTKGQWTISTTSGSTGKPFYFPRQALQDQQYATTAELYLRSNFSIHTQRTLYIVAFPMGAWIGGVFTYEALQTIARKQEYDLSIITPGIHKQEVINAVLELSGSYDQVIIGAYAPFLKDILDDGERHGINWSAIKLGFVFSAEAFSETFRDYVLGKTQPESFLKSTLNHYGTVDMGTMAHETPESILIRRHLVDEHRLDTLFPESDRQPTFCQYDPNLFYFESQDHNLICTAYSGLPLVRYDLKDYGGVITRSQVHKNLTDQNVNITQWLQHEGLADTSLNLPFVYIYERNDFTVSYYAFLIYPETIRRALLLPLLQPDLTGKFTMYSDYNIAGRQELHIHVETKAHVQATPSLQNIISEAVHATLVEQSSEYRETVMVVGADVIPKIHLHSYEDPEYFKPGGKQKWIKA